MVPMMVTAAPRHGRSGGSLHLDSSTPATVGRQLMLPAHLHSRAGSLPTSAGTHVVSLPRTGLPSSPAGAPGRRLVQSAKSSGRFGEVDHVLLQALHALPSLAALDSRRGSARRWNWRYGDVVLASPFRRLALLDVA